MSKVQQTIIRIESVGKNYEGKQALKSISLDIKSGQVVGCIGPNGAGKSTLIKILIGIIESFEGVVEVCGFNVRDQSIEIKKRVGYVPEVAELYTMLTPLEYLLFIGRIYQMEDSQIEKRAIEMLSILGLKDELNNPMANFSKGMRQRVLITAAIIHDPEILFLDEPLSGLDANSVILVKEIIAQLAKAGKTIFYCSHMMDVVEKVCDRIVIISKGDILADGSFSELQDVEKETSLEAIFNQITSNQTHTVFAEKFVKTLSCELDQ